MGWDTYLWVDSHHAMSWRKAAGHSPRVLFVWEDLVTKGESGEPVVQFVTTAARAVRCLESQGFSWHQMLADYEQQGGGLTMGHGFLLGAAATQGLMGDHADERAGELEATYRAFTPKEEFEALSRMLVLELMGVPPKPRWRLHEDDRTVLETLLDSSTMHPFDFALRSEGYGLDASIGAIQHMMWLTKEASLLAWPFAVMALLRGLDGSAPVVLDLTEDADRSWPGYGDDDPMPESHAREYAEDYWSSAITGLSRSAEYYGRMFASVAVGVGELGEALRHGAALAQLDRCFDNSLSPGERGSALEELLALLVERTRGRWRVLEKRLRHEGEELDLVVMNRSDDPAWVAMRSPIVLIECKNWRDRVGVPELRILESKMEDRSAVCHVGLLVALNGTTKPLMDRVRQLQSKDLIVIVLENSDLRAILADGTGIDRYVLDTALKKSL